MRSFRNKSRKARLYVLLGSVTPSVFHSLAVDDRILIGRAKRLSYHALPHYAILVELLARGSRAQTIVRALLSPGGLFNLISH